MRCLLGSSLRTRPLLRLSPLPLSRPSNADNLPGDDEGGDSDDYAFADDGDEDFDAMFDLSGEKVRAGDSPFLSADALSWEEMLELAGNEDDDPYAEQSPLYGIDAKEFLTSFFHSVRGEQWFVYLAERLPEADQELVRFILNT